MKHIFTSTAMSFAACITLATLTLSLVACGGGKSTQAVPDGAPKAVDLVTTPPAGTASTPSTNTPTGTVAPVGASLKEQIDKLEQSGALPKLDRSASIPGPDVNNNGVRDDIEAYIAALPLSPVQKLAAMQKAKALHMTLTVDLTDKVALQKVGDALMASTACLSKVDKLNSDFDNMTDKFEGMTANTKERAKQYMAYNAARSGSVTSWPKGDTCKK